MKEQILNYISNENPWRENLIWFDCVDSTNTRAKALAAIGLPHGTVLVADCQSRGRGRMDRDFHSPAGKGIYMSVLLRPDCPQEQLMHLTCAVGVAMCDAVESVAGVRPGIKWTNDLVCNSRKIGGILTELVTAPAGTVVIVGVGINCSQQIQDFDPQIQSFAGSLSMVTGEDIDRAKLAAAMVDALHHMHETLLTGKEETMARYREDCITLEKDISIVNGDEVRHGFVFGIDDNGALQVGFADGHKEIINSGEVSIRGMYGYV